MFSIEPHRSVSQNSFSARCSPSGTQIRAHYGGRKRMDIFAARNNHTHLTFVEKIEIGCKEKGAPPRFLQSISFIKCIALQMPPSRRLCAAALASRRRVCYTPCSGLHGRWEMSPALHNAFCYGHLFQQSLQNSRCQCAKSSELCYSANYSLDYIKFPRITFKSS